REIVDHISTQFRKSVAKKADKAKTADRKLLSRARVITTEDVLKLREARDAADAVKIAKAEAKEAKKKAKEDSSTLDKPPRETLNNEEKDNDEEEWVNMVEILAPQVLRRSGRHQGTH
ncbi:hypothetical protein P167DRAFT_579211, partial [Morchella conica CCBAS932]